jgi:hypothetical protein
MSEVDRLTAQALAADKLEESQARVEAKLDRALANVQTIIESLDELVERRASELAAPRIAAAEQTAAAMYVLAQSAHGILDQRLRDLRHEFVRQNNYLAAKSARLADEVASQRKLKAAAQTAKAELRNEYDRRRLALVDALGTTERASWEELVEAARSDQVRLADARGEQAAVVVRYQDLLGVIFLHVKWRWLTKQVETEQKELWADAVDAWSERLNDEENGMRVARWWREDYQEPAEESS